MAEPKPREDQPGRGGLTVLDKRILRGSLLAFALGAVLVFLNLLVVSAFQGTSALHNAAALRDAAGLPVGVMLYAVILLPVKILAARIVRRGIEKGGTSERHQAFWAVTLTNLVIVLSLPLTFPYLWPIVVSLVDEYLHWLRGIRAYKAAPTSAR